MLWQTLRADGLLANMTLRALRFPARELFGFALPLVIVDLLFVVMNTTNVWMLQASARGRRRRLPRRPAGREAQLMVMTSFALLFTPAGRAAVRARGPQGIHELYWRTAAWIAVFSFPVFALTFPSADALTVALFGHRYAARAPSSRCSLRLLLQRRAGLQRPDAPGLRPRALRVVISVAVALANVAINLVLIPAYGAVGAAVGTCATLVLHNVLKQAGLRKGTGIGVFDREHLRVYGAIVVTTLLLLAVQVLLGPPAAVSVVLVAAASAALLFGTRSTLRVGETFPELRRVPVLRRMVAYMDRIGELTTPAGSPGVARFLTVLRRWRGMLAAAALTAGVIGYLVASSGTPTYEARSCSSSARSTPISTRCGLPASSPTPTPSSQRASRSSTRPSGVSGCATSTRTSARAPTT